MNFGSLAYFDDDQVLVKDWRSESSLDMKSRMMIFDQGNTNVVRKTLT